MGIYDTIVLLVVLAGAFFGWRKGFATQVASIVSVSASFFVAMNFQGYVTPHIDASPPMNGIAAFVILFVATWIVAWLAFGLVRSWIESLKLKEFDYQMGALFGGFKGFLVACVLMIVALSVLQQDQHVAILGSRSGQIISKFLTMAEPILPEQFRLMAGPFLSPIRDALPPGYDPGYLPGSPQPGYSPQPMYSPYATQPPYELPVQDSTYPPPGTTPWQPTQDGWRANSPPTTPRF